MNQGILIFMKKLPALLLVSILGLTTIGGGSVHAADPAGVPKKMKTKLGLYFTPIEAYKHMKKHGARTLFIDVRDPIEVNFTGMPTVADANVPLKFADTSKFHMKKKQFGMKGNKNFVADIGMRLKEKGLSKNDTVIIMCRSGPRGAKAVDKLAKAGYTKVYNLIQGFEGFGVKKGAKKGQRTINGWKNAGLPWNPPKSLSIKKMYGNPAPIVPKPKKKK